MARILANCVVVELCMLSEQIPEEESRVAVAEASVVVPAPVEHPRGRRPDRPARRLGGRPRPRRRDRLGGRRGRARRVRAEGRDGALGRGLAGERLRVGAGAHADPAELRRPLQLGADRRRPLADADRRARPGFRATVAQASRRSCAPTRAIATVVPPRAGRRRSPRDGHTAIVVAGAKSDPTAMVAAADTLKGKLHALATRAASRSA